MSTYFERFYYFLETTNPLTLLTTKEQVNEAKRIVSHDSPSSPEYKKARTLLDSVVHPDTGEPILAPFRFSAFVPMNLIILSGMLHPSQQTPMLGMFWQTLNQTYNVALNYSNRNASSNLSSLDLFKSYCLAVGVSCSLSFAGAKLAARSKSFALRLLVPYSAVACASVANVLAMRSAELTEGVSLQDANGKIVANGMKSQVAGYTGLAQVALSRIMFPIPFVLCPPIILEGLKMSLLRSATAQTINLAYVTIITACLWIGTPACIAIFPQIGEIDVKNLEQPFQNLIDDKVGKPYTKLYYNKGL